VGVFDWLPGQTLTLSWFLYASETGDTHHVPDTLGSLWLTSLPYALFLGGP
jgi:hypothetical protein